MSIQDISLTNNQKKLIFKTIKNQSIIVKEDNGDLVINVAAYLDFSEQNSTKPLEEILEDISLNYEVEYFVFS